ncbi:hypothetical protein CJ030_MR1G003749 [Morella rubra]|uniref:Uncharacterized protein n=1 Tax=Morella rubra TaxID=262757 RepID=A0A6A1WM95_9ROSI|nr:hypothetical protein CJ030_MR1G003749 [Morella rubra]
MGIQRRVGVFPVMETKYKLFVEEVFCTFPGQDLVIVESLIRQNDILPLWYIMLLIFAYNIYPRRHTGSEFCGQHFMGISTESRAGVFPVMETKYKLSEEATCRVYKFLLEADGVSVLRRLIAMRGAPVSVPTVLGRVPQHFDGGVEGGFRMILEPMQLLCMDISSRLTTLEANSALSEYYADGSDFRRGTQSLSAAAVSQALYEALCTRLRRSWLNYPVGSVVYSFYNLVTRSLRASRRAFKERRCNATVKDKERTVGSDDSTAPDDVPADLGDPAIKQTHMAVDIQGGTTMQQRRQGKAKGFEFLKLLKLGRAQLKHLSLLFFHT